MARPIWTGTSEWEPDRYRDTYREQVLELLERKAEGEAIVTEAPPEESSNVVDLMSALEASIERARGERSATTASEERKGRDQRGRLQDMTREELYEEAQRRDIDGRSKMTKRELADALGEAS